MMRSAVIAILLCLLAVAVLAPSRRDRDARCHCESCRCLEHGDKCACPAIPE